MQTNTALIVKLALIGALLWRTRSRPSSLVVLGLLWAVVGVYALALVVNWWVLSSV